MTCYKDVKLGFLHMYLDGHSICQCGKMTKNEELLFTKQKESNTFMTFQQFDEYQEALLKEVVVMKTTKGKEYANSEDRFANFNRLAPRLGISNLAVCLVYLTKHMDAIESYCKNQRVYSTESIQGRIVDAITYLTLLGGMIKQKDNTENHGVAS
jgi:hypothetical protein